MDVVIKHPEFTQLHLHKCQGGNCSEKDVFASFDGKIKKIILLFLYLKFKLNPYNLDKPLI